MAGHMSIPVFIPHEGCPHDCVFCSQRKITGVKEALFDEAAIRQTIEDFLSTAGDRQVEIAFFGGSFTGIPWPQQQRYLELAKGWVDEGRVAGIRFSTRPDYITEAVMARLAGYPVSAIELGVQSLDSEVLERSRRGHSPESVAKACRLVKAAGIELGIQMMLGLPGDTFEKSLDTLERLAALRPDTLRIYPALVFDGTELARMYREGAYQPLALEEAVAWCKRLVPKVREAGIRLIRLGLHNTAQLGAEGQVLAGPHHPAFGQLVYDGLVQDAVEEAFRQQPFSRIRAGRKVYQQLAGYKRQGFARLSAAGIPRPVLDAELADGKYIIDPDLEDGQSTIDTEEGDNHENAR